MTAQGNYALANTELQSNPIKREEANTVKASTQHRTEGKLHEAKGIIKERSEGDKQPVWKSQATRKRMRANQWIGRAEKAVGE